MYDIGVALRRFKGLIKWAAHKYGVSGSYNLSPAELEAEGLLLLVQCCRGFQKDKFVSLDISNERGITDFSSYIPSVTGRNAKGWR